MNRAIVPFPADRWRVIRLVSSVVGLVVLVVAAPIALVVLGGVPFAHAGVSEISHSLSSRSAGDPRLVSGWIANSVLVLAWLAWAWLTVCVIVEVRSWVTGRTPARLPASRTMQSAAAFLVGTALALATVGRVTPTPKRASVAEPKVVSVSGVDISRPFGPGPQPSRGFADGVVPISLLVGDATGSVEEASVKGAGLTSPVQTQVPPHSSAEWLTFRTGDEHVPVTPEEGGVPPERDAGEAVADTPPDADRVSVLALPKTHLVRSRETLWSIAEDELARPYGGGSWPSTTTASPRLTASRSTNVTG